MTHPMEELLQMIRERGESERALQNAERKIKAAGYSDRDWYALTMFHETFNDQAGALAYYLTVASKTGDRDAARIGMQVAEYVAKRATWIDAVCQRAGVPLADLNMRQNMAPLRKRMLHAQGIFDRVLRGEDLSHFTADELTDMEDAA